MAEVLAESGTLYLLGVLGLVGVATAAVLLAGRHWARAEDEKALIARLRRGM